MYGLSTNFCCCSIIKTPPIFDRYIVPNIDGIIYFFSALENNCGEVKWKNGFPVSAKGKGGGIGLLNVQSSVKKYDGNLILKSDGNKFIAELFLNS